MAIHVCSTDFVLVTFTEMSEELYDDGFKTQVNVDFSNVVIKQMQQKYQDRVGMQCTSLQVISTRMS